LREASKVRDRFRPLLIGHILDIGAGDDPILPEAEVFDKTQGNAQDLCEPAEAYDTVWSSHCIEHMPRPLEALLGWWRLVKPGGKLILIGPDEDAYEHQTWPSLFNGEHFHSFTLHKDSSWCPASINVLDLVKHLPKHRLISAATVNTNPSIVERGTDYTCEGAVAQFEIVLEKLLPTVPFGSTLRGILICSNCGGSMIMEGFVPEGQVQARCEKCGTRALYNV
jgi:SAM-dependent methyltransferase